MDITRCIQAAVAHADLLICQLAALPMLFLVDKIKESVRFFVVKVKIPS